MSRVANKKTPGLWVRVAQDTYRNEKFLDLVHERRHKAITVYLFALCWAAEHKTDGWIPRYALAQVHGTTADAETLCSRRLWESADGGWWIHEYSEWQTTNAEMAAASAAMSEVRSGKKGSANVIPFPDGTSDSTSHGTSHRQSTELKN